MTISNTLNTVTFTGNSATTAFPYDFRIDSESELHVYLTTIATDTVEEINSASYSVSGIGSDSGGEVTYPLVGSPITSAYRLTITRTVEFVQELDITAEDAFNPESLEVQLDKFVMQIQQVNDLASRAIKALPGQAGVLLGTISEGYSVVADADGNLVEGPSTDDISSATSAAASAVAAAAAAAISESNAEDSAIAASASASAADASADAASASESAASGYATAASGSATSASNSAIAAAASASDAQDDKVVASAAADTAVAAQVAAEAALASTLSAFDSFDDRYLGAKAANPTLDNDGNALVAGALYFNTVSSEMRIYTGSTWVAAYVSGANYAALANNGSDYTASTFRTNLDLYSKSEAVARAGDTITGQLLIGAAGSLVFEGTTDNAYETTLAVTDPTADRTVTLPNATGTVALTSDILNWLRADADDAIESGAGYTATADDDGTKSTGTYTPTPAGGNFKRIVNGGAFTLAAPSVAGDYTLIIQITNNASAGAITLSGFSKTTGDSFTTTNGDDFMLYISKVNGFTHCMTQRLQ